MEGLPLLCLCPAHAAFAKSAHVTGNVDGKIDSTCHACAHGREVQRITNEHATRTDEQSLRGMAVGMIIVIIHIKQ